MQTLQKIEFLREIVLVAVYPHKSVSGDTIMARRFVKGQEILGCVYSPCADGHGGRGVLTISCDAGDNDRPGEPNNSYNVYSLLMVRWTIFMAQ